MITGECAVIRTAEMDDATALKAAYDVPLPRSCLLDQRRELLTPTVDELRQTLGRQEVGQSLLYTIEDREGRVRGFCSLRGVNQEVSYTEFVMVLIDEEDYDTPLADEVFEFLSRRAFVEMGLNKIAAHALDEEATVRAYLLRHGFTSDGVQREVIYAGGRWHDLEALSLFAKSTPYASPKAADAPQPRREAPCQ
ncbi:MAG: GNAT family N-acetyltransferase [Nitrospiraceae bacterium]|nr:GNAT family N-acetyltransferase [Nitrospiraceae bacterium]